MIPRIFLKKINNIKSVFVIDLATQMIYAGDNDIPLTDLKEFRIAQSKYTYSSTDSHNHTTQYTDEIFGLLLFYGKDLSKTSVLRTYSTKLEFWIQFGEYLEKVFHTLNINNITFNSTPMEGRSGEECMISIQVSNRSSLTWGK